MRIVVVKEQKEKGYGSFEFTPSLNINWGKLGNPKPSSSISSMPSWAQGIGLNVNLNVGGSSTLASAIQTRPSGTSFLSKVGSGISSFFHTLGQATSQILPTFLQMKLMKYQLQKQAELEKAMMQLLYNKPSGGVGRVSGGGSGVVVAPQPSQSQGMGKNHLIGAHALGAFVLQALLRRE